MTLRSSKTRALAGFQEHRLVTPTLNLNILFIYGSVINVRFFVVSPHKYNFHGLQGPCQ